MTQNTLNAHLMIHTGVKKHLCNFCGNSFLSRGQLKIHERFVWFHILPDFDIKLANK